MGDVKNYLIILSGGVGSRMNSDIPKQYILVNKKPILQYTIECFNLDIFEKIVIVVADTWKDYVNDKILVHYNSEKFIFAKAGESRQESILNGLIKLKEYSNSDDVVVIHDGARPNVSQKLMYELLKVNENYDGVMPVLKVKDTIYRSNDGKSISSLLNRDELFLGQSPESYKYGKYYTINAQLTSDELSKVRGSSEIAFKNGLNIGLIDGEEKNFKITTPTDLDNFKIIIGDK